MKTRNKVFIGSGVLLLVMIIAGYGIGSACGPWGGPEGSLRSRFCGGGFHKGFHSSDMADFVIWKMDRKADELNLTETQRAKYETLRNGLKAHFSEKMDGRRDLRERFHEEMGKENPDLKPLISSAKEKVNELSGFANKHLDLLADFYDSLDSSQKRKIADTIRERMEERHGSSWQQKG